MTTKSYSKHKEYKEISSRSAVPYTDEQFDMLKSELIPKGSKLDSIGRGGVGTREYHYEYKEEKLPGGKYDRKDYHAVEEYTVPARSVPKSSESSSYYYEKEERELPAITTGTRTYNYETTGSSPGYSKVNSKVTKEMSQNVEELDSLLDDLQKDQERQLYKSGYTSDTAESTSFDYRRGTPVKPAPSSGYSTLKHEERVESSSWGPSPPPTITRAAELRQQVYREEKTESRVVPSPVPSTVTLPAPQPVPAAVCAHCHQPPNSTGTLPRAGTPMNKVTTTVKTYTYEVPADTDPTTVPIPTHDTHATLHVRSDTTRTATLNRRDGSPLPPAQPTSPGCLYCAHCNSSVREYRTHLTTDEHVNSNERVLYPANDPRPIPTEPHNGHGPYGPTSYKYSETTYSSHNSNLGPAHAPQRQSSPAPFPRPHTPSPGEQQPPKRLDDLLADFPEAQRFPTETDSGVRRRIETREIRDTSHTSHSGPKSTPTPTAAPSAAVKPTPVGSSKNVAGPAVYYPPGHTPFAKKEVAGYQASSMQGGGAYASARGAYEYEAGSRSKEKRYETKTAVPVCLPLCCAMPCVIL